MFKKVLMIDSVSFPSVKYSSFDILKDEEVGYLFLLYSMNNFCMEF